MTTPTPVWPTGGLSSGAGGYPILNAISGQTHQAGTNQKVIPATNPAPKAKALATATAKASAPATKDSTALPPNLINTLQKLKSVYAGHTSRDALLIAQALSDSELKTLGISRDDLSKLAYETPSNAVDSAWNSVPAPPAAEPPAPNPTGSLSVNTLKALHGEAPVPDPPATQGPQPPVNQAGMNQKSLPPPANNGIPGSNSVDTLKALHGDTTVPTSSWGDLFHNSAKGTPVGTGNPVPGINWGNPNSAGMAPLTPPSSAIDATSINNLLNSPSAAPVNVDIPNAPAPYQFKLNDFTKQADSATAQAFAPQYTALDQGKQAAQTQYGQSDSTIQGLYNQLTQSDKDTSVANQAAYQKAMQSAAASTQNLQGNIADTYNNTAQTQANLLQNLGIQAAAPDVLKDQAAASNFNQVQAATQGKDQQDYVQNSANADQTYQGNMQSADQAQGASTRSDLVNQLNGVLNQYDQQKSAVASDQSQSALQLAQQLQGSDMSLQQANYGSQQDAYSNALQKAQLQLSQAGQNQSTGMSQAQLALQLQQAQNDAAQGNYTDQFNAQQAAISNNLAQQNQDVNAQNTLWNQQFQTGQQAFNQQFQIGQQNDLDANNQAQNGLSAAQLQEQKNEFQVTAQQNAAADAAKVQASADPSALTFDQNDPYSQWYAQQLSTGDPSDPKAKDTAASLVGIINNITLGQDNKGQPIASNAMSSQNAFILAVSQEAAANGITPDAAIAAATSYWQNVLGMPAVMPQNNN